MNLVAERKDGAIMVKGDIVTTFTGETWTFEGVTHYRKINVSRKEDPSGPDMWPNLHKATFYANVLDLGIRDTESGKWTFTPEWF